MSQALRASKEPGIASFVILTLDAVFGFCPILGHGKAGRAYD